MNLFIEIDSSSNLPLYKQVANAIKDSIDSGRLQEGKAVPSTRQLSVHLGVSRITVVQSYEQLVSQGYLKVITGTGTFVSRREKTQLPTSPTKANINHFSKRSLSQYGTRLIAGENQQNQAETAFGLPPTQLLPLRQWQKL
ncbi:MAG: GntR family transcriptional regulator / MocR family aminotransferase, partial [Cyanobacteriota bacterium erpe_2018_sw_21hr_WHONDRS-SW48-000092_B_bin.40]|nr:GntR family transcriptional regulator / MocR family aminotransferase [Cyanobacteriota bacterium erpe_2018_sw_21hr_WHONDRS-SW48-000092_B_bin.40]